MAGVVTGKYNFYSKGMGLLAPLFVSGLLLLCPASECTAAGPSHIANQDARPLKKLSAPFTFVVMGDNRTGTGVYGGLVKRIANEKPAFVINVGDVTADESEEDDYGEWNEFVRLTSPIKAPYFIAPGNHEINDRKSETAFRDFVTQPGNGLYFSFRAGDALIIVLDTEEPGLTSRIVGNQLAWFKGVLSRSREKYRFVFMHRPMYPDKKLGRHYGDSLNRYPKDRDGLQELLIKYGVDAVFAGHEHFYKRGEHDKIVEVITGGGGAPLYTPDKDGGFYHYIRADVGKGSVDFKVIDNKGTVRDTFKISKGD